MKYEIIIKKSDIQHQVNLRTHYHCESEKRKGPDANVGESSEDENEIMDMFLQKCMNQLIAGQTERLKEISFAIKNDYVNLKFTGNREECNSLLPILKQSVTDYIVNELMIHWLLIRQQAWSEPYIAMRNELYIQVQEIFAQFCSRKVRRRPTDLAGI